MGEEWGSASGAETRTCPLPTSSTPSRRNGVCARRGNKSPGPQAPAGFLSGASASPGHCGAPRVPVRPPHIPSVITVALEKSRARARGLSPAHPASEAPTPALSLAETLPVRSPVAPAARTGNRNRREHGGVEGTGSTTRACQMRGPQASSPDPARALAEPARGTELSQRASRGRGEENGLGSEGRAQRHFRWGRGCGWPHRPRPRRAGPAPDARSAPDARPSAFARRRRGVFCSGGRSGTEPGSPPVGQRAAPFFSPRRNLGFLNHRNIDTYALAAQPKLAGYVLNLITSGI
ncbi:translation initiation factor IF-2-like isoform X2 [Elephas maximus indicus]|uniref:translation initiation factor IF-2-like isoform X2 n=1 Tax=Elephas maximus indicus TaxID=99487 RepID=UPI002115E0B2|nr:translation initiation factor IF-2-like isoform X2 [Elephas maximus indicus]